MSLDISEPVEKPAQIIYYPELYREYSNSLFGGVDYTIIELKDNREVDIVDRGQSGRVSTWNDIKKTDIISTTCLKVNLSKCVNDQDWNYNLKIASFKGLNTTLAKDRLSSIQINLKGK